MAITYKTGLPKSIGTKLYKTGQTRGAERDEIYQNRVVRSNTALIPLAFWNPRTVPDPSFFESGHIVFARPAEYFGDDGARSDAVPADLELGKNLLVFFRSREDWDQYDPRRLGWTPATSRDAPLGGQYIARVPDTTSSDHAQIFEGYTGDDSGGVGAGIRFFEYAPSDDIEKTRYQLAYLAWRTVGMEEFARSLGVKGVERGRAHVDEYCRRHGLATLTKLEQSRLIEGSVTVCPLCLKPMEAAEMASRVEQMAGREVSDLTVTSANLFHIQELQPGVFNHRPYNLGWGHHHCNAVTRDNGLYPTLAWMEATLRRNGYDVSGPPGPDGPLP